MGGGTTKKHIRALDSVAVQGLWVPANSKKFLVPSKYSGMYSSVKGGVIAVHNTSSTPQLLVPSQIAQEGHPDFTPRIPPPSANKTEWVAHFPTFEGNATLPLGWDNPNLLIEIIRLPHSLAVGQRELTTVGKWTAPGSMWTSKELVSAVKAPAGGRDPGTNNPKNYMGFDRTNWKEFAADIRSAVPEGTTFVRGFQLGTGPYACGSDEMVYVLSLRGEEVAFVTRKDDGSQYDSKNDSLDRFLSDIGAPSTSGCISLFQKVIRRRPVKLRHPDDHQLYDAEDVLRRIVRRMCGGVQAGIFLPNIGKHVTALQHFLKRLFVISAEDSEFGKHTVCAAMLAFLASEIPMWSPSSDVVTTLGNFAINLWKSNKTSDYRTDGTLPLPTGFAPRAVPCFVHDHMGGMKGDTQMLRWLASNETNTVYSDRRPDVDSLDVYCDQHVDGRLACLLPAKHSVADTLQLMFDTVSGRNPRRVDSPDRRAEAMVWDALTFSSRIVRHTTRKEVEPMPDVEEEGGEESVFKYTLHEGAIAGMVGQLVVIQQKKTFYATLCSRDLSTVVVRKPGRSTTATNAKIDEVTKTAIITVAHEKWRTGTSATNVVHRDFVGSRLRRTAGGGWEVLFQSSGTWVAWGNVRKRSCELHRTPKWDRMATRQTPWPWVSNTEGGGAWGDGKSQTFDAGCIQFVVGRMASFDHVVTIPKTSREGKGVDEALSGLEVAGYQLCTHLSELFPDALWPSATVPYGFDTACVSFRHKMCEMLLAAAPVGPAVQWPEWRSALTLTSYQSAALADMLVAWEKKFASFLWMLVGTGKTLTVLTYLHQTAATGTVVWALPKTAIASVVEQIESVGWPCVLLCKSTGTAKARKKSLQKGCPHLSVTTDTTLRPHCVTLVEHDMLRDLVDKLASQMPQAAFVFDEVHKAMQGGTKRTASALRLAKLSKQLVALTGTPIVTKQAHGLREWLKLCVPFPVRTTNFWVAANSMVTHLNTGKIVIAEREERAPETYEEGNYFYENFPERVPWHGKPGNRNPTDEVWGEMQERSRAIADEHVIALAVSMYQRHPPNWQQDHTQVLARQDADDLTTHELAAFSKRPVVVAANRNHAVELLGQLLGKGVAPEHILIVGGTAPAELNGLDVDHAPTVHLTEAAVLKGEQKPYRVVIAPVQFCEGYSLTWMTHMITGVHPSNQASRSQMRGRIARLDAQRKHKTYITVLAGVTRITYRHHEAAKQMERALRNAAH